MKKLEKIKNKRKKLVGKAGQMCYDNKLIHNGSVCLLESNQKILHYDYSRGENIDGKE